MSTNNARYIQTGVPRLRADVNSTLHVNSTVHVNSTLQLRRSELHARQDSLLKFNSQSFIDHQPPSFGSQFCVKHAQNSHQMDKTDWKKQSLVAALSFPDKKQKNKEPQFMQSQCFHLRSPLKPPLQQSISLPVFTATPTIQTKEQVRRNVNFSKRPLPLTPHLQTRENETKTNNLKMINTRNVLQRKSSEGSQIIRKKEPLRRKAVHTFQYKESTSLNSFDESFEDHIYEEIDEGNCDSDDSEKDHPFLNLISSERRKNLRFYGCTGWDFGTEVK